MKELKNQLIATVGIIITAMWVLGMGTLLYGLISGEADVANATFGVFDYL